MMGPVISSRGCGSRAAAVPPMVSSKTRAQTHPPTSLVLPFSNPKSQLSLFNIHHKLYHTRRNGVAQSNPKMVTCSASAEKNISAAKKLRLILDSPGVHQGPACFDALSALLVQRAGFDYCFTSGFSISAAKLGLPDTGFISYGEMVDQGQQITQAVSIPVIGDADNGYGNPMNVKRTVKGYIRAGFAGIILEDQVSPKACGHTRNRKVVSREEAIMRIKAAVDAREETGSDIVIVARTDSRQAVSLDESLWRSRAFADAGADVVFIDALASREEMKSFCEVSPLVPKMANMLEGGGKTPMLTPFELEELGYKLVAYPLSLMGVSIRAMQDSLAAIKGGRIPPPGSMPSFEEIKDILGFNTYYEEEKRYAISSGQMARQRGDSNVYGIQQRTPDDTEKRSQSPQDPVVEVITPEVYSSYGAGFLDGITNIVPALGGVNIKELLDDAAGELGGKLLLDFNDTLVTGFKYF
ncbi:2,3-dimethylmalate lyase [Salix suchowensis]|nr:2,3-dimethylmalate lyase [Salix suchowensis]